MKKSLLLLVTLLASLSAWADVEINETNFPDDNFRNWLLEQNYGNDGVLTDMDIAGIKSINVFCKTIADLTGIEHFTALDILNCSLNQLKALDVSHNTALLGLNCSINQINGENMEALVASLPTVDVNNNWGWNGNFSVINLDSENEQNVITTSQVLTARGKNWTVLGFTNYRWEEYDGSTAYAISLPASFEHGTVTCDKETATEGETVTLTVTPDNGYELETLTVTIANADEPSGAPKRLRGGTVELTPGTEPNTYTFEMPDAPVTVNATFTESVPTSVAGLRSDKPVVAIYTLAGMCVDRVSSGVYIVKYADGTIAKVRF